MGSLHPTDEVRQRPRIGVTLMVDASETGHPAPRYSMSRAYFTAVRAAGGIPVALVPGAVEELSLYLAPHRSNAGAGGPSSGASCVETQPWDAVAGQPQADDPLAVDGLCLTGGGDLDPGRYGQTRHLACQEPDPERDEMEFRILDLIGASRLPILAICRGLQVANAYYGGGLHQDLATHCPSAFKHDYFKGFPRDMMSHDVSISAGSRLSACVGNDALAVNSFHHQAIARVAPGWKATAWASDGIIEAIEPDSALHGSSHAEVGASGRHSVRTDRFFLGVQWHPECLMAYARQRAIFSAFMDAAREHRRRLLPVG
jgi:putative glutamine amidotransferase